MKCDDAALWMSMLLDDMLGDEEKDQLLAHVDQCDNCRKRFDSFQRITLETRSLPQEAPPELHEKIMEGIRRQKRKKVILWRKGLTAAAACAAMVLLVIAGTRADLWTAESKKVDGVATAQSRSVAGELMPEGEAETENVEAAPMMLVPPDTEEKRSEDSISAEGGERAKVEMVLADGRNGGYLLPQLDADRSYGEYLVAVGSGELPRMFSEDSVTRHPEKGLITIEISRTDAGDAAAQLADAGFVIQDEVSNLPPTDDEATDCLIIIVEE